MSTNACAQANQLAPSIQRVGITELGCTGDNCISLSQLAALPAYRLPPGCQLDTKPVFDPDTKKEVAQVDILVCRTSSKPEPTNTRPTP